MDYFVKKYKEFMKILPLFFIINNKLHKINQLFLITNLLLWGQKAVCAEEPSVPPQDQKSQEILKDKEIPAPELKSEKPKRRMLAEPISPTIIKKYPHLSVHLGQLILGNENLQVILQGIQPLASHRLYQSLILDVYQKKDQTWIRFEPSSFLQIATSIKNGKTLTARSIELSIKPDLATITFSLRPAEPRPGTYQLAISLPPTHSFIHLAITGTPQAPSWKMKWTAPYGQIEPDEETKGGTLEEVLDETQKKLAWYHYNGETLVFVGHQQLSLQNSASQMEISPTAPTTTYQGLDIYFTEETRGRLARQSHAAQNCSITAQKSETKSAEAYLLAYSSCLLQAPPPLVRTKLKHATDLPKRMLYLLNKSKNMFTPFVLSKGEETFLELAADNEYEIYQQTNSGYSLFQAIKPVVNTEPALDLSSAGIKAGTLILNSEASTGKPALVSIFRQTAPLGSTPFVSSEKNKERQLLSPFQVLVTEVKKSLEIELLPDSYFGYIFNEKSGIFCPFAVKIDPDKKSSVACSAPSASTAMAAPATMLLATHGTLHPLLTNRTSAELMDISIIGSESTLHSSASKNDGLIQLPVLGITDPTNGLRLQTFVFDEKLRSEWQRRLNSPTPSSLSEKFNLFCKEKNPEKFLELSCPPYGMSFDEIDLALTRIQPTTAAFVGCRTSYYEKELLQVLDHHNASRKKGMIFLSAAAPLDNQTPHHTNFARNVRALPPPPSPAADAGESSSTALESYLHGLNKGQYSVTKGVLLEDLTVEVNKKGASRQLLIQLRPVIASSVLPTKFTVISDRGELLSSSWPESLEADGLIKIEKSLSRPIRWIRVEVNGHPNLQIPGSAGLTSFNPEDIEFLLASSNYIEVNNR
jgi:hypothetical protein